LYRLLLLCVLSLTTVWIVSYNLVCIVSYYCVYCLLLCVFCLLLLCVLRLLVKKGDKKWYKWLNEKRTLCESVRGGEVGLLIMGKNDIYLGNLSCHTSSLSCHSDKISWALGHSDWFRQDLVLSVPPAAGSVVLNRAEGGAQKLTSKSKWFKFPCQCSSFRYKLTI